MIDAVLVKARVMRMREAAGWNLERRNGMYRVDVFGWVLEQDIAED